MADRKTIEMKPFLRNGEEIIAGLWEDQVNLLASDYHRTRNGIMKMRAADPETAKLYDKFLKECFGKSKKNWAAEDLQKLQAALQKNGLGPSSLLNDVALDLKDHGYNPSYKPPLAISVNNRPMNPLVIERELKALGIEVSGETPRSSEGKISNDSLTFKRDDLIKGLDKLAVNFRRAEDIERELGRDSGKIFGHIAAHAGGLHNLAKDAPVIGKILGVFGAAATGNNATPTQQPHSSLGTADRPSAPTPV